VLSVDIDVNIITNPQHWKTLFPRDQLLADNGIFFAQFSTAATFSRLVLIMLAPPM